MMYPTIFALGVKGLGPRTKTGGACIVMAIVGGGAVTPAMGKVCDMAGVSYGYLVPAVCFVIIALYAWFGSQPEAEELVEMRAESAH